MIRTTTMNKHHRSPSQTTTTSATTLTKNTRNFLTIKLIPTSRRQLQQSRFHNQCTSLCLCRHEYMHESAQTCILTYTHTDTHTHAHTRTHQPRCIHALDILSVSLLRLAANIRMTPFMVVLAPVRFSWQHDTIVVPKTRPKSL